MDVARRLFPRFPGVYCKIFCSLIVGRICALSRPDRALAVAHGDEKPLCSNNYRYGGGQVAVCHVAYRRITSNVEDLRHLE